MSNSEEIRWKQRLQHFETALSKLTDACEPESYSELEMAGLIQFFIFSLELCWNTLKDLLYVEGIEAKTPRAVWREAHAAGFVEDVDTALRIAHREADGWTMRARRAAEAELEQAAAADASGEEVADQIRIPLEALVGAPERIERLAAFIVEHWEKRRAAMEGKAMIVTMSRDIAARLYEAIEVLRPDWHDPDDTGGMMKVIVTGRGDDEEPLRNHVRTKAAHKRLAERFKNPDDDLRLSIVCDMWLTGFDCPPAHTMYLDKPLAGHNLMQAIARVNRVYGEKPGGLIVDLLGLADQLADALATYTQAGGTSPAKSSWYAR